MERTSFRSVTGTFRGVRYARGRPGEMCADTSQKSRAAIPVSSSVAEISSWTLLSSPATVPTGTTATRESAVITRTRSLKENIPVFMVPNGITAGICGI
ncbi:MAG: hypothetical protein A4E36_01714 [Methanoregulaceae archaeon PtaB.Bin009]|nr:MAG: hypothetical protein A4E36_01714 [Methanoregulaceae archaeon PtaB.Bin009]